MTRIDPNNTQAILIGASEFDFANDEYFQNLPNVKSNLLKLNHLLIDVVHIDKNKICLMLDKDNSSDITSEIIKIIPNASDTLIVYYAGHGIPHLKNLYLATKKTQPDEPEFTGAMESKHFVNLVIKKAKAKNLIFIIDCCFSARAKEGVDSRNKQVFFITAAPSTQAAKDESPEDANYTAFTHELLVIFEQGIDNAGDFLTFQDIANHLSQQLKDKGLPEPQLSIHGSPDKLGICKNRAYHDFMPKEKDEAPIPAIMKSTPNDKETSLVVSGKIKIQFCRRLGKDWQDLATCLDIPAHRRAQFQQGRECHAIWEWLEERDSLDILNNALNELERQDLVKLLNTNNK
jgi:hypothetical protein